MRPTTPAHFVRRSRVLAGALIIVLSCFAVALAEGSATAASAAADAPAVSGHVQSRHIAFRQAIVVTGTLPTADAGHRLALQFRAAGSSSWQALAATTVGHDGHYRVSARLGRSGLVRVVDLTAATASVASASDASAPAASAQRVTVAASLQVPARPLAALGGGSVSIHGHMLPRLGGRVVWLEARRSGRWQTVAATRTGRGGSFTLRFTPSGSAALRVRFTGDLQNAKTVAPAGSARAYSAAPASWYNDGGTTGCGFHAFYGVANKSLPCGTKVNFVLGGRSVTATVDDRGPYVGNRVWDLNQNTAAALGFGGLGTVWASY